MARSRINAISGRVSTRTGGLACPMPRLIYTCPQAVRTNPRANSSWRMGNTGAPQARDVDLTAVGVPAQQQADPMARQARIDREVRIVAEHDAGCVFWRWRAHEGGIQILLPFP